MILRSVSKFDRQRGINILTIYTYINLLFTCDKWWNQYKEQNRFIRVDHIWIPNVNSLKLEIIKKMHYKIDINKYETGSNKIDAFLKKK